MTTLLTKDQVQETLRALPGWEGDPREISREVRLTAEQDAELRRQVDVDAAAMGHFPEVAHTADGTRFVLRTPEVGGVSELDVALAAHISDLTHRMTEDEPGVDAVRADQPEVVDAPDLPMGDPTVEAKEARVGKA